MSGNMYEPDIGLVDLEVVEKPLLLFMLGVLGCAPLDFPRRLADKYDAAFVSSDEIRLSLMNAREAEAVETGGDIRQVRSKDLRKLVKSQTAAHLRANRDVVIDMFFNGIKSRDLPRKLATQAGALTVALWINTPFRVAARRVDEWTEKDAFVIPVARWDMPPAQVALTMMNGVVGPSNEGIDYVFNLRGETDTDGLLAQFQERLERYGLADRYEDLT